MEMDPDDGQLLHRYVSERAQDAFTALVHRHFAWVHRAAWRQLNGDGRLVDDVAQSVFVQLAHKASALTRHPSLAGWLHTTTRYTAAHALRSETRRQGRETNAQWAEDAPDTDREGLRRVLDQAIAGLDEQDRDAVLLKYFEGRSIAEVAARIRTSEGAAYKRLERALEKLRTRLATAGIASSAAALAAALEAEAAVPVAPGLANAVALRAGSAGLLALGRGGLITHAVHFMTASKTGLTLAALVSALAVGSTVYQTRQSEQAKASLAAARQALAAAAKVHEADVSRLRAQARQSAADAQKWAELQQQVSAIKAQAAAPASRRPAASEPRMTAQAERAKALAAGQAFLAAYPQARTLLMQIGKVQVAHAFGGFFRSTNLTPTQMDNLVNQTAQHWIDTITFGPQGVHPGSFLLPDSNLQQILGDQGFQQFKNFERLQPLEPLATQLAALSDSPMSPAQTDQLVTAMANASSSYEKGGTATPNTIDWNQVAVQAQGYLTPQQLSLVQYQAQMWKLGTLMGQFRRTQGAPHQ